LWLPPDGDKFFGGGETTPEVRSMA